MIAVVLVYCGIVYSLLSIIASVRFRRRKPPLQAGNLPVSILKAVRGRDVDFCRAIRSHALIEYTPGFEILFGVSDPQDPALQDIGQLQATFPNVAIRVIATSNDAPNGKVGSLQILAEHAAYPVILLNDSDIYVEPDYLDRVIGKLLQPGVGMVTCLYRGTAHSSAAAAEGLGIATEFAPSVLVSDMLSASHFGFGSTIALRIQDLQAIGGFAKLRNFLADDYQIGMRIANLGKKVLLSEMVVETSLGAGGWLAVWKHQVRWSRTIRVSNPAGYFGFIATQLTMWSLAAAMLGHWKVASAGLAVRMVAAAAGLFATHDRESARFIWATPLRDLFGFAVWAAAVTGNSVEWRGLRFRLRKDGTIEPGP